MSDTDGSSYASQFCLSRRVVYYQHHTVQGIVLAHRRNSALAEGWFTTSCCCPFWYIISSCRNSALAEGWFTTQRSWYCCTHLPRRNSALAEGWFTTCFLFDIRHGCIFRSQFCLSRRVVYYGFSSANSRSSSASQFCLSRRVVYYKKHAEAVLNKVKLSQFCLSRRVVYYTISFHHH